MWVKLPNPDPTFPKMQLYSISPLDPPPMPGKQLSLLFQTPRVHTQFVTQTFCYKCAVSGRDNCYDVTPVIFSDLTKFLQSHRRHFTTGWIVLLLTNKRILMCKIGGVIYNRIYWVFPASNSLGTAVWTPPVCAVSSSVSLWILWNAVVWTA